MKPASELTPEQAVLELETLADSRPPEDQVLDLIHWRKQNQARVDELEARLLKSQENGTSETPAPPETLSPNPESISEVPVIPTAKPEVQRMAAMMGQLLACNALCKDAKNLKNYSQAKSKVYSWRAEIKKYARKHGLEAPDFPEIPENTFTHIREKPVLKEKTASIPVAEPRPLDTSRTVAALPPEAVTKPVPMTSVASIRRSIWMLMAELEEMSQEGRADLVNDLALLDAAAHAAHGLATGRLEVA